MFSFRINKTSHDGRSGGEMKRMGAPSQTQPGWSRDAAGMQAEIDGSKTHQLVPS